ncbi:MAG: transcription-repair coupling factor [Lachnospiraceae bacterium]|nr:transcription-repair coupling factor [Lachnospiraceae bacterium]
MAYKGSVESIENEQFPIYISGSSGSERIEFIYALANKFTKKYKWKLIITTDEIRGREICDEYKMFDTEVLYYPAKDLCFYSVNIHGQAIASERLKVIERLIVSNEGGTIVTTMAAGLEMLQSLDRYADNAKYLKVGEEVDFKDLSEELVKMGYERQVQIERPGEFAVRGGIIDIFPLSADCPVRIEFWGDEIDTIREFDVDSQRSIDNLTEVVIFPASEIILSNTEIDQGLKEIKKDVEKYKKKYLADGVHEAFNNVVKTFDEIKEGIEFSGVKSGLEAYLPYFDSDLMGLFEYFNEKETLFIIDNPVRSIESAKIISDEFSDSMTMRLEKGYAVKRQLKVLRDYNKLFSFFNDKAVVMMGLLDTVPKKIKPVVKYNLKVQAISSYGKHFDMFIEDVKKYRKNKYKIVILSSSHTRSKRIKNTLNEYDIPAFYKETMEEPLKKGEVLVSIGSIKRGFIYPDLGFMVISESEIFGSSYKKKLHRKHKTNKDAIKDINVLKPGDYCIHENHGLAVYEGMEKINNDGVIKDYIKLRYGDGGILYVSVANLDMLQKYAAKDADTKPKLDRLEGKEWYRKKSRVRKNVRNIAKELVKIYAARQEKKGFAFLEDTVWQKEFEEVFPYEETMDQLDAIEAVKSDMESTKIMDRLICGDVGYGKTEVALRAAFKCVMSGKQVALLVPTTILCQQHYNTFLERINDFPINVAMLSRFVTKKQADATLKGLKKGEIDIVIGTHRLLSKDVEYKDLGLLIVDEEQRFGVTHKEKIKDIKKNVDAMALSATPIPRTLHMSLAGIRDMSVLTEPPTDRMPIQTFVMEYNDEAVREAIVREVARGGQVYYVFNRIDTISDVAYKLSLMLPEVNIAYAHGRMNERELEKIMMDFISGEIDVLISTTIIETGLDIPNVNTIIIENSDRMGLSQLYQLRGRVGRSNRMAYAFLMYRKDKILSEVAEKRLGAIREFTELGSGIKIAMRDLEIRGAGNVLGAEQSGHMGEVGYDLYLKMLSQAVKEAKGEVTEEEADEYDFETTVDIHIDAYIPASYIKSEYVKLDIYKKIAVVETETEKSDMIDELIDRFGDVPIEVRNLIDVALIKAKAHSVFINKIAEKSDGIRLYMKENTKMDMLHLAETIKNSNGKLKMYTGLNPYILIKNYDKEKIFIEIENVLLSLKP